MDIINFVDMGAVTAGFAFYLGFLRGKKAASPSSKTIIGEALCVLFLGRTEFLFGLNETIDGRRYIGLGSALLLSKQFDGLVPGRGLQSTDDLSQTMENLWRTATGLDFLLLANYHFAGVNSTISDFRIQALTREEAVRWAQRHAEGRDIAHV